MYRNTNWSTAFPELPRCKTFTVAPLINWNGLLFKNNRDIQQDLANLGQIW